MGEDISLTVVEAIASERGVDPIDLQPPLYDAIDPGALDALFRRTESTEGAAIGFVEFSYQGCRVVVDSTGDVEVSTDARGADPGVDELHVD